MTKQMTKQADEVEILTGTADLRALLESGAGYRMAVESIHGLRHFRHRSRGEGGELESGVGAPSRLQPGGDPRA